VQASVLVRAAQFLGPARALPVRFEPAPPAVKPPSLKGARKHSRKDQTNQKKNQKKNAKKKIRARAGNKKAAVSPEEKEYRLRKKLRALPQVGVRVLQSLRDALDARPDTRQRQLLVSGDGSYTNRPVLQNLPERTTFIGRIRKDAKLFWTLPPLTATRSGGRPRRYGAPAPTPEQVLHDDTVPVVKVRCFAAGQVREIPVKVVRTVYWRKAGPDMPLLSVVIKPLGYRLRKGSKLLYRQPAFLICTDPPSGSTDAAASLYRPLGNRVQSSRRKVSHWCGTGPGVESTGNRSFAAIPGRHLQLIAAGFNPGLWLSAPRRLSIYHYRDGEESLSVLRSWTS
jgi:hypothetical protein